MQKTVFRVMQDFRQAGKQKQEANFQDHTGASATIPVQKSNVQESRNETENRLLSQLRRFDA